MALAIGLIIGIERGWQGRVAAEGERALGLRSFALTSLLGGIWAALARDQGGSGLLMLAIVFVIVAGVIAAFRIREIQHHGTYGATTILAALMAFSLGALAVLGNSTAASAAAVVTASILALKPALHAWVARVTWVELRAGLLLLAMSVIVLPVLPNRELGPLQAFNPHEIWLMTVLIATVSFAGYVAVKVAGERNGILFLGLAGGLVSSTAVTLAMGRLARAAQDRAPLLAAGCLLASLAMLARVGFIVTVFSPELVRWLAIPLLSAGVGMASVAWTLVKRKERTGHPEDSLHLQNPFDLRVVLVFGALLTAIMFAAKASALWIGASGLLGLAAVAGLADVDAITLSLARMARSEITPMLATAAILLALLVNTATKVALAWTTGGPAIGRLVSLGSTVAVAFAGIGLSLSFYLIDRLGNS